jgi:phosphoserine phosphatase
MPSSAVVATLIADPHSMRLSDAHIAHLTQGVGGFDSQRWLDEGVAADVVFSAPLEVVRAALGEAAAGEPVDVIVQPATHRAKRLLVADMDSTLIGQEGLDELATYAGVGERVAAITERAMRGEIAFEPARQAARRIAGTRHRRCARRPHYAHSRRAHARADDARERRSCRHRLGRLSPVHCGGSRPGRR